MAYAGRYRTLTCLSLILSALSGILALVPFVRLWCIIREVLEVQPDFSRFSFHRFKASIDDYQTT